MYRFNVLFHFHRGTPSDADDLIRPGISSAGCAGMADHKNLHVRLVSRVLQILLGSISRWTGLSVNDNLDDEFVLRNVFLRRSRIAISVTLLVAAIDVDTGPRIDRQRRDPST